MIVTFRQRLPTNASNAGPTRPRYAHGFIGSEHDQQSTRSHDTKPMTRNRARPADAASNRQESSPRARGTIPARRLRTRAPANAVWSRSRDPLKGVQELRASRKQRAATARHTRHNVAPIAIRDDVLEAKAPGVETPRAGPVIGRCAKHRGILLSHRPGASDPERWLNATAPCGRHLHQRGCMVLARSISSF